MQSISNVEYRKMVKKKPRFSRSPKSDRTEDGIVFDSKAELVRYRELKLARSSCLVLWFIRQPLFDLAGVKYHADFLIVEHCGLVRVEEVKGRFKGKFRADALRRWKRNAAQVKQIYGVTVELIER